MQEDLPESYSRVLVFGTEKPAVGQEVQIGGVFLRPLLEFSYLLAARRLLAQSHGSGERLDVVAFPVAYLQRHAFELAVKGVIAMASELEHSRKWLRQLERRGASAVVPSRRKLSKQHDLEQLIKRLGEAVNQVGYDSTKLPRALDDIARRLTTVEQDDEHRFRYGTFDEPVVLELGAVQGELEALFSQHFWLRDWHHAAEQGSIYGEMAMELESLSQHSMRLECRHGLTTPTDDDGVS